MENREDPNRHPSIQTQCDLLEWQEKAITAEEQQSYPQGDLPGAQKSGNMVQMRREHCACFA